MVAIKRNGGFDDLSLVC